MINPITKHEYLDRNLSWNDIDYFAQDNVIKLSSVEVYKLRVSTDTNKWLDFQNRGNFKSPYIGKTEQGNYVKEDAKL